jgi:hypothetical protein
MKTQTQVDNPEVDFSGEAARQPEILPVNPEIERIERMSMLHDTLTHKRFKDALIMCSVNMLETGRANAFAVYKTDTGIEISDPVLAESESGCRFGIDPTKCAWKEETKIDELFCQDSPKHQELFCTLDQQDGELAPRKDVWACIMGFPMGGLDSQGLRAIDLQRPTKAYLDFYSQKELLCPGFVGGVLTNDGEKAGLLLFKKSEVAKNVNTGMWSSFGTEDGIARDIALTFMAMSGMVYADIDLTCPKNRDPDKLYEKRVKQAINAIYSDQPPLKQLIDINKHI